MRDNTRTLLPGFMLVMLMLAALIVGAWAWAGERVDDATTWPDDAQVITTPWRMDTNAVWTETDLNLFYEGPPEPQELPLNQIREGEQMLFLVYTQPVRRESWGACCGWTHQGDVVLSVNCGAPCVRQEQRVAKVADLDAAVALLNELQIASDDVVGIYEVRRAATPECEVTEVEERVEQVLKHERRRWLAPSVKAAKAAR